MPRIAGAKNILGLVQFGGNKYLFPNVYLDDLKANKVTPQDMKTIILAWTNYLNAQGLDQDGIKAARNSIVQDYDPQYTAIVRQVLNQTTPTPNNITAEEEEEDMVNLDVESPAVEAANEIVKAVEAKGATPDAFALDKDTFYGFPRIKNNPDAAKLPYKYVDGDPQVVRSFKRIARGDRPVFFMGASGTGKTAGALFCGQEMGLGVIIVPHTAHTEVADILGSHLPGEDGALRFVEGPLVRAYEQGMIYVADEVTALKPGVFMVYQQIANGDPFLVTTRGDGYIAKRHPNFRLVFTANPPSYEGCNQLNVAQLNRPYVFNVDYPEKAKEIKILTENFKSLSKDDAKMLVDFADKSRKKLKQDSNTRYVVTTRDLVKIVESMTYYGESMRESVELCVLEVVQNIDPDEYDAMKTLVNNSFPKDGTAPKAGAEAVADEANPFGL